MKEPEYKCVMAKPKRIRLKSQTFQVAREMWKVVNFSEDKHGKLIPSGISIVIPGQLRIELLMRRKR